MTQAAIQAAIEAAKSTVKEMLEAVGKAEYL